MSAVRVQRGPPRDRRGGAGPAETATAIADAVAEEGGGGAFDLLLFGNRSADQANYQVGVRVAREPELPSVIGIEDLAVEDDSAVARREISGGEEVYELDLPAAVTVKEGRHGPRYASMRVGGD